MNDYAADNYDNDIRKNTVTGVSRYMYDPTGNVIKDLVSGQDTIEWNHYDKVTEALKDTSGNGLMFAYDGAGNRYLKAVTSVSGDTTKYDQEYEVRDAQGNVLAVYKGQSVYKGENKSVWVQYIFDDMLHAVSIGQVLSQLAGPVYAQEGHFKNSFLGQAVRSATWANGQVTAQAVSWYLLRDDAVRVNMLGHTGNYRDFYTSMASYDDGGGSSLTAAALDSLFMVADDAPDNFQTFAGALLDPKFVPADVQAQALTKLCAEEELMSQLMDRLGLRYDGKDCAGDVSQLQSYITENGVGKFADSWFEACRDLQKDFFNYLQGLTTDGDLMGNTVYTGAEGSLLPSLQKALTDWCPANRLGGFMDQWASAQALMLSTNSLEALLADVYNDDPATLMQSYVTNQGQNAAIVTALSAIPDLTPSSLVHAGELHLSWYHSVTLYQEILKYQRIWLASHVLYGSSRLGTKDYLPGQLYSLMDYEQAQPVIDSSVLNAKRPWYSAKYGDNIKPGATTAWGNTQTDPYGAAEEAGSKQYELTNHLGNVQTTVGDNRYAVADESTDTIKAFHPVIRSAYDYYPFGMLMPGRYVSDTSEHCVTISRPTWAWKEVPVICWDVYSWRWPGYTPINKGTAVVSGDAVEINAPAAGDGVSFDFPVTANVQQELDIDVERVNLNNKASVQVMELEGEDWVTLAEAPINVVSGGISIPFTPKANTVRVIWNGPIVIWVRKHCISKLEWVEEDQLVTVCDEDKDKYRWGFNDKEKVNEWAGIGNYYDYGMRGVDPRIGRFISVDPLTAKFPMLTPFQYASNRPIASRDIDGLEAEDLPEEGLEDLRDPAGAEAREGLKEPPPETRTPAELNKDLEKGREALEKRLKRESAEKDPLSGVKPDPLTKLQRAEAKLEWNRLYTPVKDPYSNKLIEQDPSEEAMKIRDYVKKGGALYRLGTRGVSKEGENAQFWSTIDPSVDPEGFARSLNIPEKNVENADFIEKAKINSYQPFITRPAGTAPGALNTGTAVEVVVPWGGTMENKIIPFKK